MVEANAQAEMVKSLIAQAIAQGIPLADLVKGIGAEAKAAKDAEAAARTARQAQLASVVAALKERFEEVIDEYSEDLEIADGVWYSWDFGKAEKECRVLAHAPKASTPRVPGATSTGKRYDVSTVDLVARYAAYVFTAEDMAKSEDKSWVGMTVAEVQELTKGQRNPNYKLRMFLLKKDGQAS